MTDSEKLALISQMIADFWGYNSDEQRKNGAEVFVASLSTIIDFNGKE